MSGRPLLDPDRSPLLRALLANLPAIRTRLREPDAWDGLQVVEPASEAAYWRLVCKDELSWRGHTLVVGVHLFEQPGYRGRLHDHRWPLAVWPFALAPEHLAEPLYDMPWEHHRNGQVLARGTLTVHHGLAWAIEDHVEVLHAVQSRRPHASINVTAVQQAPARGNRMAIAALDPTATEALRRRLVTHLVPWETKDC